VVYFVYHIFALLCNIIHYVFIYLFISGIMAVLMILMYVEGE